MEIELLPGDVIPSSHIPTTKKQVRLGPGLIHKPPSTITAAIAGTLQADIKKSAIWVEAHSKTGRYHPRPNDLVIGQVHHSSGDYYHVLLSPSAPLVILPHLSFDSATRKTRPQLSSGDLVYARVCGPPTIYLDAIELECFTISPTSGVRDEGLGPLKGGCVADVSGQLARKLMMPAKKGGYGVLKEFGEQGWRFEVAVGRNGRVWVDAKGDVNIVLGIIKSLREIDRTNDEWDEKRQKNLVTRTVGA